MYICQELKFDITVSVGAVCPGDRQVSYDYLYQCAYQALDAAKRSGGNRLIYLASIAEAEIEMEEHERELVMLFKNSLDWIKTGRK